MDEKFITTKPTVEPWTDPVTGEIYPNGKPQPMYTPTEIPKAGSSYGEPAPPPAPQAEPVRIQQAEPQAPPAQYIPPHFIDPVPGAAAAQTETKFCTHCGAKIAKEAVICRECGCQVGYLETRPQQIIINNIPQGSIGNGRPKSKTTSLLLCILLGWIGAHRFYEGRVGTGILYLFTGGLFGIGVIADIIRIATLPDPYYIN